jgi:hypothetical protein
MPVNGWRVVNEGENARRALGGAAPSQTAAHSQPLVWKI